MHSDKNIYQNAYLRGCKKASRKQAVHWNRRAAGRGKNSIAKATFKKIYDFLDIKLVFTSSASIDIIRSKYDLSRRVVIMNMFPFSFREYLFFKKNTLVDGMSLDDILTKYRELYRKVYTFEPEFHEFCIRGALPSALDAPFAQTIRNIVEKIINYDLLIYGKLNMEDIINIGNILRFISRSPVDVCNYSVISRNTGITKYKAPFAKSSLFTTFQILMLM